MNQCTLNACECTLRYAQARKVFEVQLYKNNVRTLLLRILSILNSDWLPCSVRAVYESAIFVYDWLWWKKI